jgi:hypothetical protein
MKNESANTDAQLGAMNKTLKKWKPDLRYSEVKDIFNGRNHSPDFEHLPQDATIWDQAPNSFKNEREARRWGGVCGYIKAATNTSLSATLAETEHTNWSWSRSLPKEIATKSPATNRTAAAIDELFSHGSPPPSIDKVVAALGRPEGFSRQALYSMTEGSAQPQKVGGTLRFLLGGRGELLVRTGDFRLIYEAIRVEKGGRANLLTK